MRDVATLERIRRLAIPPAWTGVWICASPNGHLQATGRDARGRKQYRYHADWRAGREANKFDRLGEFGRALPAIRRQVARDLRRPPLCRRAVLATVVRLLESTLIRVGNEEYARANGSYGLTTLRRRHVKIGRDRVRFHFRGKSGRWLHPARPDAPPHPGARPMPGIGFDPMAQPRDRVRLSAWESKKASWPSVACFSSCS